MQLSFKRPRARNGRSASAPANLAELLEGEHAIVESLDLPESDARRLMELGFLPGTKVAAAGCAPGGDPRVFRIDGSEIALRRELAAKLIVRRSI